MRLQFFGPLVVRSLGANGWAFAAPASGLSLVVRGAAPAATALLETGACEEVTLHWQADGLRVYVTVLGVRRLFDARFAVVHEVEPGLYDCLPLARFDGAAARFWRWVFFIVRLPGGFLWLQFIARRRASRRMLRRNVTRF